MMPSFTHSSVKVEPAVRLIKRSIRTPCFNSKKDLMICAKSVLFVGGIKHE